MVQYIALIAIVIMSGLLLVDTITDATLNLGASIFETQQAETEYEDFSAKFVKVEDNE